MSANWKGGSTTAWRKTRLVVLTRDGYRCQIQKPAICLGVADQAHHTKGRSVTGDDPAYLVAACGPCNRAVGDPTRVPDPPHVRPRTRW